jgi:hypothetical protein
LLGLRERDCPQGRRTCNAASAFVASDLSRWRWDGSRDKGV